MPTVLVSLLMFSCVYFAQLPGCSSYCPLFQDSHGVLNYRKRLKISKPVFQTVGKSEKTDKTWSLFILN